VGNQRGGFFVHVAVTRGERSTATASRNDERSFSVFARLHTLEASREQHELGLEIVRDQYLPWVRDSTGFRGLIGLADEERGKAIVITLWADQTALDDSFAAGDKLSRLASAASGTTRRSLESFEVTLFDVRPEP
jgi:hypothetical protein